MKIYFVRSFIVLSKQFTSSKIRSSIVCTSALIFGLYSNATLANRFDPPSLKQHLNNFDSRIEANIFNVDFLLAHVVNNSRKIVREAEEIGDSTSELLQNTSIFTNNSNTNTATAGSVVIPAGTNAETIIIINQNEGDSIAIHR